MVEEGESKLTIDISDFVETPEDAAKKNDEGRLDRQEIESEEGADSFEIDQEILLEEEELELDESTEALTVMPTVSGAGSSSKDLPIPPQRNGNEKVDTSKLDAALKENAASKSSKNTLSLGEQPISEEIDPSAKKAIQQATDGDLKMSGNDKEDEVSKEKTEDASAGDNLEIDSDDSGREILDDLESDDEESLEGTEGDRDSDEDSDPEEEDVEPQLKDQDEKNSEQDADVFDEQGTETLNSEQRSTASIDPEFAKKVTQVVHADTAVPLAETISTTHVEPLRAQSVEYERPEIVELHKKPMLEKEEPVYSSLPVDKMPIVLSFETGRQKITVGELEKIKEGYTFECGNPTQSPVTICANDTPIGTGELLDIDGKIGVRIIEFYNK